MMSVSGHSSLDQMQEYLDEVDQERAAKPQWHFASSSHPAQSRATSRPDFRFR
jgi:hypothetical protein